MYVLRNPGFTKGNKTTENTNPEDGTSHDIYNEYNAVSGYTSGESDVRNGSSISSEPDIPSKSGVSSEFDVSKLIIIIQCMYRVRKKRSFYV